MLSVIWAVQVWKVELNQCLEISLYDLNIYSIMLHASDLLGPDSLYFKVLHTEGAIPTVNVR